MIRVTPHTTICNLSRHLEHYENDQGFTVRVELDHIDQYTLWFHVPWQKSGAWDDDGYQDSTNNKTERQAIQLIHLFLKGPRAEVGIVFDSFINQAIRTCYILKVTRTRCRIWYDLPKSGETYAWRKVITLAGIRFVNTNPYG